MNQSNIVFLDKLRNTELGWTLGAMIYEANLLPIKQVDVNDDKLLPNSVVELLLGLVGVLIILIIVLVLAIGFMCISQRTKRYEYEPINNP